MPEVFKSTAPSVNRTDRPSKGHGLVAAFTAGCPITPAIPLDKVVTVAGMAQIAYERELYFNLHTKAQTFFGDILGQLHLVE